jgi:hypothetical protein
MSPLVILAQLSYDDDPLPCLKHLELIRPQAPSNVRRQTIAGRASACERHQTDLGGPAPGEAVDVAVGGP